MINPGFEDGVDVRYGADTDEDGRPDTVVLANPLALVVTSDLDRDGIADVLVRFGPDGSASALELWADPVGWWPAEPPVEGCHDELWPDGA